MPSKQTFIGVDVNHVTWNESGHLGTGPLGPSGWGGQPLPMGTLKESEDWTLPIPMLVPGNNGQSYELKRDSL